MIGYEFNLHDDTRREELGSMPLVDDDAAIAFGKQVIRDLLSQDDQHLHGWTLEVTADERTVANIRFGEVNAA